MLIIFWNSIVHLIVWWWSLTVSYVIVFWSRWLCSNRSILFHSRWWYILQNLFTSCSLKATNTTVAYSIIRQVYTKRIDLIWFSFYILWWLLLEQSFLRVFMRLREILVIGFYSSRSSTPTSVILKISGTVAIVHATHYCSSMLRQGWGLKFVFTDSSCTFDRRKSYVFFACILCLLRDSSHINIRLMYVMA